MWYAALLAVLAACLSGCGGLPSIKNPFAKSEEKLPGQRIAVITDRCLPDALEPVDIPKIIATANAAEPKLRQLIVDFLEQA